MYDVVYDNKINSIQLFNDLHKRELPMQTKIQKTNKKNVVNMIAHVSTIVESRPVYFIC